VALTQIAHKKLCRKADKIADITLQERPIQGFSKLYALDNRGAPGRAYESESSNEHRFGNAFVKSYGG
jgi:hypothetical protein